MKLQLILLDDLFYRGTGPTGATGPTGPTDTYDYFFNKINCNYSFTKNIHHIKL